MIHRDPRCVFVADNLVHAEIVSSWLDEHGVPAEVMNRNTLGGLDGLTPWSTTGISSRGLEIWVRNADDAQRARELLEHHEELRAAREAVRSNAAGSLLVTCEDCGEVCIFPASQQGTVQNCRHCGSYIDVEAPGADDEQGPDGADEQTEDEPRQSEPDTRIEPA